MRQQGRGSNITDPCVIGALLNDIIITRCCHDNVLSGRMELYSCPIARVTCILTVWGNARERNTKRVTVTIP